MCGSIASRVLLATLCVPIEPTPSDVDRFLEVDQAGRDKARRLAALLRMNTLPTRASLLRDIVCVVCVFTCTHTHTHTRVSPTLSPPPSSTLPLSDLSFPPSPPPPPPTPGTPQHHPAQPSRAAAALLVSAGGVQSPPTLQEGLPHTGGAGVRRSPSAVRGAGSRSAASETYQGGKVCVCVCVCKQCL